MRSKVDYKFICAIVLLLGIFFIIALYSKQPTGEDVVTVNRLHLNTAHSLPKTIIEDIYKLDQADLRCKIYSCFDVYRCGNMASNQITVYLYPLSDFVDPTTEQLSAPISREFYELYATIASSPYYVDKPEKACLFVPPVDLLSQGGIDIKGIGRVLASLPYWNHGINNLLFNMLPGKPPEYSTTLDVSYGKALIAGGGFSHWTYRSNFDVSIPVYSAVAQYAKLDEEPDYRKWLLISAQTNLHNDYRQDLEILASNNPDFLLLQSCKNAPEGTTAMPSIRCKEDETTTLPYPQVLQESMFCLILPTVRLGQSVLSDALKTGCIPVIACDTYVLPFSEVLDWQRAAVVIQEERISEVVDILKGIPPTQIHFMREQGKYYYDQYFSSMSSIVHTTLQIINDRVFPDSAKTYDDWNKPVGSSGVYSPLFLPLAPPEDSGFTAVILAYDRVDSLFQLISSIDKVPSLRMILVVWNNQQKAFPPRKEWPIIRHEWKVIQTSANKLSNRFFPYPDIKTEAVLAIDDDIVMLTTDEIEFGYQVWREFPDRLVGFPPRLHLWMNNNKLKYESEWKNNVSIVLTGAAFYHNYFNHLYTHKMPGDIRNWVDKHMNCEDIAMNFIVSNHTGKAPIKVTPRKKFKCSACATMGSLSLDENHMVERSTCMNYFMSLYGTLPLKAVSFRADPVLFKDDFPEKLKRFPNMGLL